jgi:hypothetical protein
MIEWAIVCIAVTSAMVTYFLYLFYPKYGVRIYFILAFGAAVFYFNGRSILGTFFGWFFGFIFSLIIPLLLLSLAALTFLALPEQFGGPHSGCSYLDIDRTMISKEIQDELIPSGVDVKVARTVALDVLFSGRDSIQLRRHSVEANTHRFPVYTISSKLVTASVDCD